MSLSKNPRVWRSLLIAAPFVFAALMVWLSNMVLDTSAEFNEQQGRMNDDLWKQLPRIPADSRIVLVTVDKDSRSSKPRVQSEVGFARTDYAELVRKLDAAAPVAIGLDVDFHEPSPAADPFFRSVLGAVTNPPLALANLQKDDDHKENADTPGGMEVHFYSMAHLLAPRVLPCSVMNFAPDLEAIGCVPFRKDFATGKPMLHLSAALAIYGLGGNPAQAEVSTDMSRLEAGTNEWVLGADQEVVARWTKSFNDFPQYSFTQVMTADVATNRKRFEGKLVIIGDVRPGIDLVQTPAYGPRPGVYFVAQMVNTFLMPPRLSASWMPLNVQHFLAFLLAVASSFCVLSGRKVLMIAGPVIVIGFDWFLPTLTTRFASILMEGFTLTLPAIATTVVSAMLLAFKAGKFDTRLAGEVSVGAVLFVDVRGSTAMTKEIGGRGYQEAFADFMARSSSQVEQHGGQVERTTGDGFVAVFPERGQGTAALYCYQAAVKMFDAAAETSQAISRPFEVAVALECGPMTGGFVSERGVKSWSTSGNTVNLAARLLAACSTFDVRLAVGPTAATMLEEDVRLRKVGQFLPKGFEDEVAVFAETDRA